MLSLDISSSQTHDKIQSQLKALIDEYDKNPDIYLMLSQVKMLQGQHFATELETAKKLSNGHPFIVLQESYLSNFADNDIGTSTNIFINLYQRYVSG